MPEEIPLQESLKGLLCLCSKELSVLETLTIQFNAHLSGVCDVLSTGVETEAQARGRVGLVLPVAHTLAGGRDPHVWNHGLEGRAGRGLQELANPPSPIIKRKLRPKEVKSTRTRARVGGRGCTGCRRQRKERDTNEGWEWRGRGGGGTEMASKLSSE